MARSLFTEALRRFRSEVPDINRLMDSVDDALRGIIRVPVLQGRLVESVSLTSTFIDVTHGLGRPAVGYIVVSSTDGGAVKRERSSERNPSQTIRLAVASGTDTVDLWVF